MTKLLAALLLSLGFALPMHAQLGVYAGFTTSKLNLANTNRTNGGMAGLYYDNHHFPLLNFGVDLRGVLVNSDDTTKVTSVVAGPRAILHVPVVPIHPYVEGLVGGAHVQTGQGVARYDGTNLAAGFAAGADLTILPYIDWRVLDYNVTRLQGPHTSQTSFTTGLVIRIPFL